MTTYHNDDHHYRFGRKRVNRRLLGYLATRAYTQCAEPSVHACEAALGLQGRNPQALHSPGTPDRTKAVDQAANQELAGLKRVPPRESA